MCGMCAARCPAELSSFQHCLAHSTDLREVWIPPSQRLAQTGEEIRKGKFEADLKKLKETELAELQERFKEMQATQGSSV
jgi:nitrate/nitrite-specific signal transduction histidine kinase